MQTYDPQKFTITVLGNLISGFVDGTFIKAYRNEDIYSLRIGADGTGARIRNANLSGRFEITLLSSSPSNDVLAGIAQQDEVLATGVGPTYVKDGVGTARAAAAESWVVKHADLERAKELGEVTWIIETNKLELNQGSAAVNVAF